MALLLYLLNQMHLREKTMSMTVAAETECQRQLMLQPQYTLNLIGFFLCGLVNNFGYVVMLSAAGHLLEDSPDIPKSAVLLADILPTFLLKLTAPFFMHKLPYSLRVWIVAIFGVAAFQMTGWLTSVWLRLTGVIFASISAGFGEVTFLAMSSFYHKNTVSAWSSGTGGAGIFGSFMYLMLTSWIGLSSPLTLLVSSVFPFGILIAFYFMLAKPFEDTPVLSASLDGGARIEDVPLDDPDAERRTAGAPLLARPSGVVALRGNGSFEPDPEPGSLKGARPAQLSLATRFRLLGPLLKYMLPLMLVYFSEYLANQAYYVYYQFLYQSGVFVSRSSVNFFPIRRIWIPSVLQFINLVFLWSQAYFLYLPSAYIVFVVIFWEGLLGGATYVNAFYRISQDVEEGYREFSLGVTSVGDSTGIVAAAVAGFFVEPWLKNRQDSLARQGKHPARRLLSLAASSLFSRSN
ncbi:BTN1 protein [Thecamonas trahens ATCC 50062]|uniref:BTN1 protein n=1 Tax=Thecamonas trahens ATCC 50062 TaxID=461836 RepID=A0A0L0DTU0_THETB|nr:BTN1 protein [Thecamonas trahens ATCC 50062]KNC54893.1 BTN1 protein [Thecamonas trahens ATCC 50062]|eukprot:XP_013753484.1 BTN1 protein [Thecamonas trahens ATCC 50062]